jgi:hypothetical protein
MCALVLWSLAVWSSPHRTAPYRWLVGTFFSRSIVFFGQIDALLPDLYLLQIY